MRTSKTLAKLRAGKAARICGLGHFIPAFVRYAAHYRYDCIWLDLEHRAMDDQEVQALAAFFHCFDIDCMLRPPTLEKTRLYRYLEDGVAGLLIPHVSTVEKARQLVQAVKFPPLGDRGLDGAGLDVEYSLPDSVEYAKQANRETFLIVQIETPEAVENVEQIAAVEGIDGLFLGPGDLGLRLSLSEDELPTLDQSREKLAAACAKHGKSWGQPAGSLEQVQELYAQGARLLAHGSYFNAMIMMLEHCSQNLDAIES